MSKRGVLFLVIIITTAVVFGVGRASVRFQAATTPKQIPSNSINNLSQKPQDTISIISKEEAVSKAQNILSKLSLKSAELKKAEISKDPVTAKEYWDIQFEGASVDIDPESGNVIGISVKTLSKGKFIITETAEAEKAARELYRELQAPDDFKLIDIKKGNGGDFWSTVWEKEVIPGVYSKYESVNLLLTSDTGNLRIYRLFNTPPKSLEIKVTKDQAVATARTVAETKGFETFSDVKLDVEQASDYWASQGSPKRAGYCTLVWAVTFKDSSQNRAMIYVDTLTGLVVGGDQTK